MRRKEGERVMSWISGAVRTLVLAIGLAALSGGAALACDNCDGHGDGCFYKCASFHRHLLTMCFNQVMHAKMRGLLTRVIILESVALPASRRNRFEPHINRSVCSAL